MSRSYKKNVRFRDYLETKFYKRYANKVVRRYKGEIADGKAYRKVFCSYAIHDVDFHIPRDDKNYTKLKRK